MNEIMLTNPTVEHATFTLFTKLVTKYGKAAKVISLGGLALFFGYACVKEAMA